MLEILPALNVVGFATVVAARFPIRAILLPLVRTANFAVG